ATTATPALAPRRSSDLEDRQRFRRERLEQVGVGLVERRRPGGEQVGQGYARFALTDEAGEDLGRRLADVLYADSRIAGLERGDRSEEHTSELQSRENLV